MATDRETHWRKVYTDRSADAVSWYRAHLEVSLRLLERAGMGARSRLIDVGGGASTLVDDLLARGLAAITMLDIAEPALDAARQRLGAGAAAVTWLAGDVTRIALPEAGYDLWHDRAMLHFLTDTADAAAYVSQVRHALAPGGHAVIGGFAGDGPERCSGLPVARRDAADVAALFGAGFELLHGERELHQTPWGAPQSFAYALLRKVG